MLWVRRITVGLLLVAASILTGHVRTFAQENLAALEARLAAIYPADVMQCDICRERLGLPPLRRLQTQLHENSSVTLPLPITSFSVTTQRPIQGEAPAPLIGLTSLPLTVRQQVMNELVLPQGATLLNVRVFDVPANTITSSQQSLPAPQQIGEPQNEPTNDIQTTATEVEVLEVHQATDPSIDPAIQSNLHSDPSESSTFLSSHTKLGVEFVSLTAANADEGKPNSDDEPCCEGETKECQQIKNESGTKECEQAKECDANKAECPTQGDKCSHCDGKSQACTAACESCQSLKSTNDSSTCDKEAASDKCTEGCSGKCSEACSEKASDTCPNNGEKNDDIANKTSGDSCKGEKCEGKQCEGQKCGGEKCAEQKCDKEKCDGQKCDGQKCDGQKCDGQKCDGQKCEGQKCEGQKCEGQKCEGSKQCSDSCKGNCGKHQDHASCEHPELSELVAALNRLTAALEKQHQQALATVAPTSSNAPAAFRNLQRRTDARNRRDENMIPPLQPPAPLGQHLPFFQPGQVQGFPPNFGHHLGQQPPHHPPTQTPSQAPQGPREHGSAPDDEPAQREMIKMREKIEQMRQHIEQLEREKLELSQAHREARELPPRLSAEREAMQQLAQIQLQQAKAEADEARARAEHVKNEQEAKTRELAALTERLKAELRDVSLQRDNLRAELHALSKEHRQASEEPEKVVLEKLRRSLMNELNAAIKEKVESALKERAKNVPPEPKNKPKVSDK